MQNLNVANPDAPQVHPGPGSEVGCSKGIASREKELALIITIFHVYINITKGKTYGDIRPCTYKNICIVLKSESKRIMLDLETVG